MIGNLFDIRSPANRKQLSWIGGGIVVLIGAAWAVVTYIWPPHGGAAGINCAQNASLAAGGDVNGVTINANGATLHSGGPSACGNAAPKKP